MGSHRIMVLHRSAKADPSGYPGSIPGVSVLRNRMFDNLKVMRTFSRFRMLSVSFRNTFIFEDVFFIMEKDRYITPRILNANLVLNHRRVEFSRTLARLQLGTRYEDCGISIETMTRNERNSFEKGLARAVEYGSC